MAPAPAKPSASETSGQQRHADRLWSYRGAGGRASTGAGAGKALGRLAGYAVNPTKCDVGLCRIPVSPGDLEGKTCPPVPRQIGARVHENTGAGIGCLARGGAATLDSDVLQVGRAELEVHAEDHRPVVLRVPQALVGQLSVVGRTGDTHAAVDHIDSGGDVVEPDAVKDAASVALGAVTRGRVPRDVPDIYRDVVADHGDANRGAGSEGIAAAYPIALETVGFGDAGQRHEQRRCGQEKLTSGYHIHLKCMSTLTPSLRVSIP